ncbi:ABC transporter ATP-binding protein [Enterococcus gallinarum]|uniref:ABC transporter ATP-binding protein n=1 Tax=Enterococcus gallinarum TaxID=1353 RepID=UPI0024334836|nr:ATP-binding cassette domain-containing protein [Enterococcus gallinarum]
MINIDNLSKSFGKIQALKDVTLTIDRGKIVGVIGRNGAGKSTLFKILSGLIADYEGSCTIKNQKISVKNNTFVSYMPEERGLDGRLLVKDHLVDLAMYKGIKRKKASERIDFWLNKFNLIEKKNQRVDSLSKGNQQKIQFIEVLVNQPELLILDEPFSGLDPISTDIFWEILLSLREQGTTIIFSSHNLSDKMNLCDEFILIKHGQVEENGTMDKIQNSYGYFLELINKEVPISEIKKNMAHIDVETMGNYEYKFILKDIEEAKIIQSNLGGTFTEKFFIRRPSLLEIFRIINSEENENR